MDTPAFSLRYWNSSAPTVPSSPIFCFPAAQKITPSLSLMSFLKKLLRENTFLKCHQLRKLSASFQNQARIAMDEDAFGISSSALLLLEEIRFPLVLLEQGAVKPRSGTAAFRQLFSRRSQKQGGNLGWQWAPPCADTGCEGSSQQGNSSKTWKSREKAPGDAGEEHPVTGKVDLSHLSQRTEEPPHSQWVRWGWKCQNPVLRAGVVRKFWPLSPGILGDAVMCLLLQF